jgi:hypothetical protein
VMTTILTAIQLIPGLCCDWLRLGWAGVNGSGPNAPERKPPTQRHGKHGAKVKDQRRSKRGWKLLPRMRNPEGGPFCRVSARNGAAGQEEADRSVGGGSLTADGLVPTIPASCRYSLPCA